ncbi:MAG: M48 family metalloprotease [Candidatus Palauibacterales bacterium]|nr:M48 family metalloprotease [Candidatus Palauibacterales bacterium]
MNVPRPTTRGVPDVPTGGLLSALAASLVLAGCATNPATGESQLMLISEQREIEMGRQGARQVESQIGVYREGEIGTYVSEMGQAMAAETHRPDLPWSFEVADDATVNAFALPGGFIYVTRGILAYFNSGAELAAVVGHEIGHVTARHSAEQLSRRQLATLGIGIGSVLSEEFAEFRGLAGAGLQVLFLKYGRDDERQSDALGVRYMLAEDWDPREAMDVFRMLGRVSEAGGGGGLPTWLSTHPDPGDRVENIRAQLDTIAESRLETTRTEREVFLQRLDGMAFGPDPRNGYFREQLFIHPRHEVAVTFPGGWERQRLSGLAAAVSGQEDAIVRWAVVEEASVSEAASSFASQDGVTLLDRRRTSINGLPAEVLSFRARTQDGVLRGRTAFAEAGGTTVEVGGYATESAYAGHEETFERFIGSLETVSDPTLLEVEPMRIDLVTPDAGRTIAELHAERGAPVDAEQLALLNGVDVDEPLEAGRTVKWVVGEKR